MPFYKKRRFTKSKARKVSISAVPRVRLNGEKAHRHVLTCSTSTQEIFYIQNSAGGVSNFITTARTGANVSVSFSLSEVILRIAGLTAITLAPSNFSELVALYDTYQIEKVELSLWSGTTEAGAAPGVATVTCPLIGHTVDMDDANNTPITSLQQYSTYRCDQLGNNKPIKATFVPCCAMDTTLGVSRGQKQDINTGFPNAPHYGYKLSVDGFHATDANVPTLLSMQFRIHYLMKSTR